MLVWILFASAGPNAFVGRLQPPPDGPGQPHMDPRLFFAICPPPWGSIAGQDFPAAVLLPRGGCPLIVGDVICSPAQADGRRVLFLWSVAGCSPSSCCPTAACGQPRCGNNLARKPGRLAWVGGAAGRFPASHCRAELGAGAAGAVCAQGMSQVQSSLLPGPCFGGLGPTAGPSRGEGSWGAVSSLPGDRTGHMAGGAP